MRVRKEFHLLIGILFVCAGCATDGQIVSNSGYSIDVADGTVASFKTLNEQNIFMQRYDFSCGAASLATLMKFYFSDDVSEQMLLDQAKSMFPAQEYEIIAERGLSFVELSMLSEARGYQSASVRLKTAALPKLQGPILVYVETIDYRHFAILRGMAGEYVYLADPSRGNIRLTVSEFAKEWEGESFILGKEGFGIPLQHNLAIIAPQTLAARSTLPRLHSRRAAPTQREVLGESFEL